jgi:flavin reductase (DIM6/NTAB) family NADH-FMN oxidoreductase RutF
MTKEPAFPGPESNPVDAVKVDPLALRKTLGQFATGVVIVATRSDEASARPWVGMTVNSFAALSLQPALVTWALRLQSPSRALFERQPRWVINVLAEAQVDVSRKFAVPGEDKFSGVAVAESPLGLPLIHGCAAWLECRTVSQQVHGDHVLFVGEVERFEQSGAAPLVFHAGAYHVLGSRL